MSDTITSIGPAQYVHSVGVPVGYRGGRSPSGRVQGVGRVEYLWTRWLLPLTVAPTVTLDRPGPEAVGVVRNR